MLQNGVPQFVGFCRCTPCRQRRGKVQIFLIFFASPQRCTPCRQRRGKVKFAEEKASQQRCTPCRQRRGKDFINAPFKKCGEDAPRAGSAEAKLRGLPSDAVHGQDAPRAGSAEAKYCFGCHQGGDVRCTPCRQRRGKAGADHQAKPAGRMHPVQAAPRQRGHCKRQ